MPHVKMIAVDPQGSVLFGNKASKRNVPGIGGSSIPAILDIDRVDDVVMVKEQNTVAMCLETLEQRGWLIGGSTGSALAAIRQYAEQIPAGKKVVTLAADFGVNYLDTIYNQSWRASNFPHLTVG